MGSVKPVGAETGGPGGTGNRDLVGAKTGAADGQGTDIPQPVLSDAGRAVPVAESEPRAVRGKAQREGRPACSSPAVSGDEHPGPSGPDPGRRPGRDLPVRRRTQRRGAGRRSEEHTSELQSRFDLVCRLLLEQIKLRS